MRARSDMRLLARTPSLGALLIAAALAAPGCGAPPPNDPSKAASVTVGPATPGICSADGYCWENPVPAGGMLTAAWASGPNDMWVAGSDAKDRLSVWRLSKGTGEWKREPVPGEGDVIGLSGAGGKPVVLVHDDTSASNLASYLRGQIFSLEWTGSTWEKRPLMTVSSPIGKPAWGLSTDTQGKMLVAGWWGVVGTFQPGTPVSDKEDLRISTGNPALGRNLLGVWGTSPTDVVAVGASGAMLHYDGQAWSPDPAGKTHEFSAIHGAKDILVAVARQGVLLVRKGGVWSEVQTGTSVDLNGVWTDGDQTFVSGAAGAMFRCDAKGCAPMTTGTKADLWEVWGLGPNEVYVNPSSSGVLRWDGASWKAMLGPKDGFGAIGLDGQGSVIGAAPDATYRVEKGTWVRLDAGTGYGPAGGVRAIGAVGGGQLVGVYGGGGAPVGVRRWSGAKWTDEAFPKSDIALGAGILRSVWGAEGEVFIVGDGGTIVHKKRR